MQNILNLKKHIAFLIIITLVFSAVGFGLSIIQTPKYESSVQLLVIQKYGDQFDAFTARRSAETVAETLSSVVYTSSFMKQVLQAPLDIKDTFPQDLKNRKKSWKKEINVRLLESGNFQVLVYDKDKDQAEKVAYGIAYIMVTKGSEYHGGGQQVEIKMVERPITSIRPAKPNIYLNTILGFIVGLLTATGIIFLLPEKPEHKISSVPKPFKKSFLAAPHKLPVASVKTKKQKNIPSFSLRHAGKKTYTGEEYSQDKVDEWVKTGRFNR